MMLARGGVPFMLAALFATAPTLVRAGYVEVEDACVNETSLFCPGLKSSKLLRCLRKRQDVALPECRKALEETGQVKKGAPAAAKVELGVSKSTAAAAEVLNSTQAPAGKQAPATKTAPPPLPPKQ